MTLSSWIQLPGPHVPAIVYLLPDDVPMYVSYQNDLIENPDKWIDHLEGKVLYVSKKPFRGKHTPKSHRDTGNDKKPPQS